ncbi:MAG TPA: DUF6691 family protein [Desulfotignum sp.]|nr:DUF6691 family protein [Desulfotignum sp.]
MKMLIYGLVTGLLFGFLLQKGRVLRYDKQLGALRLKDMTIVKFMLSSVLVGMVGIYLLKDLGLVTLSIKATILGPVIIGALIFGLGWGLLGYCPGTSMGALGEGRWDAVWGILGMIAGAALFAEAYPALQKTIYTWGDLGRITLPQVLGVSHWVIIPVFVAGALLLFRWLEKKGL